MPGFAPLLSTKRPAPKDSATAPPAKRIAVEDEQYWTVQWRKPQQRKHKTWDGDGVLTIIGTTATLYDSDGKRLGGGKVEPGVESGSDMELAGKEISLDCPLSRDDYVSGTCFGRPALGAPVTIPQQPPSRTKKFVQPTFNIPKSRPILQPAPSTENHADPSPGTSSSDSHWTANWRKVKTSSKKQTWDGDAYVSLSGSKLTMMSEDGKPMGSMTWNGAPLYSGLSFFIGSKQVEIDARVSASQLPSCTSTGDSPTITSNDPIDPPSIIEAPAPSSKFIVPSTNFYGSAPKPKGPRHDPNAANAIVMKSPTKEHESLFNSRKHPVVPVVIDPILSRHLRPHQIEGVKFLYECVMGMRKHEGQGCILADEMGLGKTLQTISLVWTLLKQNPYGNGQPAIANAVIVCPVSLINNWKAEFHKWLGRDRVGVVACDKPDKKVIKTFVNTKTQQVLVIGYERLRTVIDELTSCFPPIGLIICDEGHRLKSAKNKTVETLKRFKTLRRIILSGTPIQNDLGEFHAMAEFCNPGLLDDYQTFRRIYEVPILKSRAPDATAKEIEMGTGRSAQLSTVAKSFVLRRDATILNNYLPPKYEYVVFVTPTSLQASMFQKILNPDRLDRLIQGPTAESLALINTLTKVSSSPILLKAAADKATASGTASSNAGLEAALSLLPSSAQVADVSLSGKLSALARLLDTLRSFSEEKIVLVSHYTSTLNILEEYCKKKRFSYYRLDGQTATSKRQEYVNAFNKSCHRSGFIFLLSSKAGGVGINLIGASRLVLVDSDWNPSHDLQSMARIHRDGQKRPVHIYRFLTAGAIDEKIYQRQVTKLGLSSAMMDKTDGSNKSDSFSRKDLRDIFRIHLNTPCNTHDLLQCHCDGSDMRPEDEEEDAEEIVIDDQNSTKGFVQASQVRVERVAGYDKNQLQEKEKELASLGEWKHINCLKSSAPDDIQDNILQQILHPRLRKEDGAETRDMSRLDRLLHDTDLDNIAALDLASVPGGTVSFVFQRSSLVTPEADLES